MQATLTENPVDLLSDDAIKVLDLDQTGTLEERIVELGVWVSGLRSYLSSPSRLTGCSHYASWEQLAAPDFKIVHSGLNNTVLITSLILSEIDALNGMSMNGRTRLQASDILEVHDSLTEALLLSESIVNSTVQGPGQWRAWSELLETRLFARPSFDTVVEIAESSGTKFLPLGLRKIGADPSSITAELSELVLVLPRFGIVLKWLSIIKKMLDSDIPLKSSLLIFVRVNELVTDLTHYITGRLDRFPDQDAELFATLDAAAYTSSIELKKVYSQELAGVATMRPAPSIYARVETAYSLLNDGFQQILASLLRVVDSNANTFELFPEFKLKLQQSLALRSDLWTTSQLVRNAEHSPDTAAIDEMRMALINFRSGSINYLFYKDTEIVERFIDEILVTSQNKDLVPILHRFGAFLETLFGQVCLRSVFEKHPFEHPLVQ